MPSLHNDFLQLLIEGLPFDNELSGIDHSLNDLIVTEKDIQMYKYFHPYIYILYFIFDILYGK